MPAIHFMYLQGKNEYVDVGSMVGYAVSGYHENHNLGMLLLAALIRDENGGVVIFGEENHEWSQKVSDSLARVSPLGGSVFAETSGNFLSGHLKSERLVRGLTTSGGFRLNFPDRSEGKVAQILKDQNCLREVADFAMKHRGEVIKIT